MGQKIERLALLRDYPQISQSDVDLVLDLSAPEDGEDAFVALGGKLDWSSKKNWVEEEGGLPKFIEDMAVHMMENSGLTREHAIAASVQRTKVLAAKGNARATAALAQWEKMKDSRKAKKAAA